MSTETLQIGQVILIKYKNKYTHYSFLINYSIILQATVQPYKKMKLIKKPKVSSSNIIDSFSKRLDNVTKSNEGLHLLVDISDNLENCDDSDIKECVKKLVDYFKKEPESAVRVKIISLFSEFAANLNIDGAYLVDEIQVLLKTEKSTKVITQFLYSLYKIGQCQQLPTTHIAKIVYLAKNQLNSSSHNIQRHSLLILGAFTSLSEAEKETLDLIAQYTDSQDSRVRAQAFRSILMLGLRGVALSPSLFNRATAALRDDYECVRKEALQLVFELGTKYPEM